MNQFVNKIMHSQYTLAVLFIVLYTLSQAPFMFEFLRWFALVPLIFVSVDKRLSIKKSINVVWFGVFGILLIQYIFFLDLLPLDWLGVSNLIIGFFVVLTLWLIYTFLLSIPGTLLALGRYSPFLFPFLWVLNEYLRSFFYSIVALGPVSSVGEHFSYSFLAYSSYTSDILLYIAPYFGAYGLSFIIASGNVVVYFLIRKFFIEKRVNAITTLLSFSTLIFIVVVEIIPIPYVPEGEKQLNVLSMQADDIPLFIYDGKYYKETSEKYYDSIKNGLEEYPDTDVVLLPEGTRFLTTLSQLRGVSQKDIAIDVLGTDKYRVIVFGSYETLEGEYRALTLIQSNDINEDVITIHKNILMPIGEYQPYIMNSGAYLLGGGRWSDLVNEVHAVGEPLEEKKIAYTPLANFSIVECSEILSSNSYNNISEADVIFHQQRLSIFHGKLKTFKHILSISQLRAAIARKPVVGSVDGSGFSYSINPYGKIIDIGEQGDSFIYTELTI